MRQLDLLSLRAVESLAETLSFRETAQRLHMTQPALSVRLKRLEDQLGLRLFDRSRAGVALSEAGGLFLPYVQRVLRELALAEQAALRIADGLEGEIRVGYTPASFVSALPEHIYAFAAARPNVSIVLEEMLSGEVEKALVADRLDVGFLHPPTSDNLDLIALRGDRYIAVMREDDPMAVARSVTVEQLAARDLVVTKRAVGPVIYSQIEMMFQDAGFEAPIRQDATTSISVLGLVAAGFGVGLAPGSLRSLGKEGLVFAEIAGDAPELPLALATVTKRPRTPLVEVFLRELTASLGDM